MKTTSFEEWQEARIKETPPTKTVGLSMSEVNQTTLKINHAFMARHAGMKTMQIEHETKIGYGTIKNIKGTDHLSPEVCEWVGANIPGYETLAARALQESSHRRSEAGKRSRLQAIPQKPGPKQGPKRKPFKIKPMNLWPAPRPNVPHSLGRPSWGVL